MLVFFDMMSIYLNPLFRSLKNLFSMLVKRFLFILVLSIILLPSLEAQVSHGGTPRSFGFNYKTTTEIPIVKLPSVDMMKIAVEDEEDEKNGKPVRIGVTHRVEYDMRNSGLWQELPEGRLWRIGFFSKNALAMSVAFDFFNIPSGADLFVYNGQKDFVIGKFVPENSLDDKTFYTQQVVGDTLFLEYYEPFDVSFQGQIRITEIGHYYKSVLTKGQSGSCEINVACPTGDNWRVPIRSVARYEINSSDGIYLCSGALINNVRMDRRQYFLSACHCQEAPNISKWTFYFNYQTSTCNGSMGISYHSVIGAVIKAKTSFSEGSDFLLLEITSPIPDNYNPYYAGWDRTSSATVGACIHHPEGDWKKISIPYSVTAGTGAYNKFWNVRWITGSNNKGVTEGGSSGSPLFNAGKRIIGQLWGGTSECDYTIGNDYFGKFSVSWNSSGDSTKSLAYWLDPDRTNAQYLDGLGIISVASTPGIEKNLSIYPNPTSGKIKINTTFLSTGNICKVYNVKGELVFSQKLNSKMENEIDLTMFGKGTYILEIITLEGRYSTSVVLTK